MLPKTHKLSLASSARRKRRRRSTIHNICMVHEIDEREGQHFIAMEFLDGLTLKHRIGGRPLEAELKEQTYNGHIHSINQGATAPCSHRPPKRQSPDCC
jgi:hypothetical protein